MDANRQRHEGRARCKLASGLLAMVSGAVLAGPAAAVCYRPQEVGDACYYVTTVGGGGGASDSPISGEAPAWMNDIFAYGLANDEHGSTVLVRVGTGDRPRGSRRASIG